MKARGQAGERPVCKERAPRRRGAIPTRWSRAQEGQALIELALVLPVLLALLLGLMEFGFLFVSYLQVQNGAREGVRLGIVGGTDEEIHDRVRDVAPGLDPARLTVSVSPPEDERYAGETLTVQVRYVYETVIPLIAGLIGGNTVPVEAVYRMRLEH